MKNAIKTNSTTLEIVNRNESTSLWTLRSIRLQIALLLAFAMTLHGVIRGNMGMALVCMIRPSIGASFENSTLHQTNIIKPGYNTDLQVDWDTQSISFIHTSFYIGTVLSVFFAHTVSQRLGAKLTITIGLSINIFCTWAIPVAVYIWPNPWLTFTIRFITGLAQGMFIPCGSLLIAKWYPEHEKSTAMAIFTTGNQIGIAVAMYATAEFCKVPILGGWPTSFFVYGGLAIFFLMLWIPLASNRPRQSKKISLTELTYIDGIGKRTRAVSIITRTPYKKLLFSPVVLAICASSFCQSYVLVAMISYLPEFYKVVLDLPISSNGLWSSLPFVIQMFSKILFAFIADRMKKSGFTANFVTKLFNNIASFGCAFCLFIVSASTIPTILISFLCFGLALASGYVPGYNTSIVCVAPNFTAFISAYSQGFAVLAGILSPIITGSLIQTSNIDSWNLVYKTLVVVCLLTGIIFQFFGSAEVQSWANIDNTIDNDINTINRENTETKQFFNANEKSDNKLNEYNNHTTTSIEKIDVTISPKRIHYVSIQDEDGQIYKTRDIDETNLVSD